MASTYYKLSRDATVRKQQILEALRKSSTIAEAAQSVEMSRWGFYLAMRGVGISTEYKTTRQIVISES